MSDRAVVEASGVEKYYSTEDGFVAQLLDLGGSVRAVDGVDISVGSNEIVGLVGESGCGKTTLGKSLICLERPTAGTVTYDGTDITALSDAELKPYRSNLQMIFQDPGSSLNPRRTVGSILSRPLKLHTGMNREERRDRIAEMLTAVNLDRDYVNRYPHQFSGGQKQRIAIARALMTEPDFVVADEPTSALDVSVQSAILNLLLEVQAEMDLSMVFIAHDLSVVRHLCDRVAVMYLGEIVEVGRTEAVFDEPKHPYTRSLLSAVPMPNPHVPHEPVLLEGDVPSPTDKPDGCSFHTRCPADLADACRREEPELRAGDDGGESRAACHLFDDEEAMAGLTQSWDARAGRRQ